MKSSNHVGLIYYLSWVVYNFNLTLLRPLLLNSTITTMTNPRVRSGVRKNIPLK